MAQFPTYLGALDAWRPRLPSYEHARAGDPTPAERRRQLRAAKFVYARAELLQPHRRPGADRQRAALLETVTEPAPGWSRTIRICRSSSMARPGRAAALDVAARAAGPYDGPVIYLGTLSKSIAPGLRVGWAIADAGDDPDARARQAVLRP